MADQERSELIIVRRRGSLDGEESHSSVWKIAYADFMTAMMAFFLVMWLISATNQETRESVANYFNPIKLTDSTPDRKGINDARRVDPGKAEEEDSLRPKPEPGKSTQYSQRQEQAQQASPPRSGEAALFRDPYAVLSEIAGGPPRIAEVGTALDSTRKEGWKGGEAFKDPFDPVYWPMGSSAPLEKKASGSKELGNLPFDSDATALSEGKGPRPSEGKPDATAAPIQGSDSAKGSPAPTEKQDMAKAIGLFADDDSMNDPAANRSSRAQGEKGSTSPAGDKGATAPPGDKGSATPQAESKSMQSEAAKLQAAISAALAPLGSARPVAEVRESNEGLLISLTDDVNYGMFATGSAEPTAGLVRALDKITPLISQSQGPVIVRGHTDNRPYRSSEYDNWRLSTARAHMAYHMLIRGGLDARRVDHIEGFADRRPKNLNDPSAAENRRIELLIRAPLP
ncbi:MotB family protein [Bradyrhizobium neotropicale]|uniref:MotB family protein n=1 Tax=Bradyrhizobium neotropicale TaxID=1497615 RepID=UPI001AD60649|nr:MotB family protein [Bradyrhizobium neotropicale]MBO4223983.1 MotB family protein [Bradyrhizobium neotropicale]